MNTISVHLSQICAKYPKYLGNDATFCTFASSNRQNKANLR